MKQIDEQVWWKYLDGDCSKEEKLHIESLLADNPSLAEEMMLRSTLHHEMEEMELITPSLDFTQNVMDALPAKAIKISEVEPLVSKKMKWLFFVASSLIFAALFAAPFLLEGSPAVAPTRDFPAIAQLSTWFNAIMISISQFVPSLPDVQIPMIPNSFLQLIGVLVLGTLILLTVDKLASKRIEERIQL